MSAEHDLPGKPKLLIVDDDPMTCRLIKLQLEMEGYPCETLSDPERILEVIDQAAPDLALVDFHLGIQGGLDLLQVIRDSEVHKHLPVILMSATDYERECRQAGADGFVLKPFNWQDIARAIDDILARHHQMS
jgi:two-component system alkaline phosphatase synthesis response regulator PhoP